MTHIEIDLFSDTNVNPSIEMRQAMCQAAVGNEVAGEDPTVNRLLELMSELLGKEASVFMPSGTMCNGIAYRVLCERPGDSIILDENAHPLLKSSALISGLAQAHPIMIQSERGIFQADQILPFLKAPRGYNLSVPRVVSIEQTTNFGGGAIWPLKIIEEVCAVAHEYGAKTHMDGARLFNAHVETKVSLKEYCKHFDSVWVDFCKTLGAPFGAVLAGSKEYIDQAWYYKFQQGGGMHQAGIMAAGCLFGLENNLEKIRDIHIRTKYFAKEISSIPFIHLDVSKVETNIIIFKVDINAFFLAEKLLKNGIRVYPIDKETIRIITHLDITEENLRTVAQTLSHFNQCLVEN